MHREPVLDLLQRYERRWPAERDVVQRMAAFVREHRDSLLRSCRPGHLTGAAWILSADRERFLLTHHRKLDRWLQLGGHADGEAEIHRAALREAQEESGMTRFTFLSPTPDLLPIDLDVHRIPPTSSEPSHLHLDVRFLLVAGSDQSLIVSDESHDLCWFPVSDLEGACSEESLLRMGRKAHRLVAGGCIYEIDVGRG